MRANQKISKIPWCCSCVYFQAQAKASGKKIDCPVVKDFSTEKKETMKRSISTNNFSFLVRATMFVLVVLSFASISYAKEQAFYKMPSTIDSSAQYLFFVHNYYVERHGPDGACKYYDILQAFADKGFIVISEVRSGEIVPSEYATKIVGQVQRLMDAGVPPENITIAGHSKGGVITLWVASRLENPMIGFVVMAGCEIKPLAQAYPDFTKLKGDFLSIYASSDLIAGSCKAAFSQAMQGILSKEVELESDKGHSLFFQPTGIWVEPVLTWFKQRK
jgi:predicted esterase